VTCARQLKLEHRVCGTIDREAEREPEREQVRKDTKLVVSELQKGSNRVIMATGDAALTALHVSMEVGITNVTDPTKALLLQTADDGQLVWQQMRESHQGGDATGVTEGTQGPLVLPFAVKSMAALRTQGYDLCVTGESLRAAEAADERIWTVTEHVSVYARMAPDDKERVIRALREHGHHTLMCGDGANDVGALKQAHVGVSQACRRLPGLCNTINLQGPRELVPLAVLRGVGLKSPALCHTKPSESPRRGTAATNSPVGVCCVHRRATTRKSAERQGRGSRRPALVYIIPLRALGGSGSRDGVRACSLQIRWRYCRVSAAPTRPRRGRRRWTKRRLRRRRSAWRRQRSRWLRSALRPWRRRRRTAWSCRYSPGPKSRLNRLELGERVAEQGCKLSAERLASRVWAIPER
jgi:hypothetical protein